MYFGSQGGVTVLSTEKIVLKRGCGAGTMPGPRTKGEGLGVRCAGQFEQGGALQEVGGQIPRIRQIRPTQLSRRLLSGRGCPLRLYGAGSVRTRKKGNRSDRGAAGPAAVNHRGLRERQLK
jgi:hypothetical protein